MATIIDGRGNVRIQKKSETIIGLLEKKQPEFKCMSIEEYRSLKFTPEQEWNDMYNPKRCSIEALQSIEIKKRGKGPLKKIYFPGCNEAGPYYDPNCSHIHIWKKKSLIQNFNGEQFQNVAYIQFTESKPGLYCCICHARNKQFHLRWNGNLDDPEENCIKLNNIMHKQKDYLPKDKINKTEINKTESTYDCDIQESNNRVLLNWERVLNRTFHILYNDKIVYPISIFKSLYLWPWQLTPYQKFKLKIPDYKTTSGIFVKSETEDFKGNYALVI